LGVNQLAAETKFGGICLLACSAQVYAAFQAVSFWQWNSGSFV